MEILQALALRGTAKILKGLKSNGPMRYQHLVRLVGFSSTTSRSLKSMEKLNLIARRTLDEPYRPVEYRLTAKGEAVLRLVLDIEKVAPEG